jgi:nickel/cobalt transporter (NicO) family protein
MRIIRPGLLLIAITAALALVAGSAMAASSLGVGMQEPTFGPVGPFAHFFFWVTHMQATFYQALTSALKGIRTSIWSAPLLVGLSFGYGIFHAIGPGHGKAVISSYMIANNTTLRRGVVLSFASSILQALAAIAVVGAAWFILRGTGVRMTDAAQFMERASFALVMVFGLWLLWRKFPGFARAWFAAPAPLAFAVAGHHEHGHHDHSHHDHAGHHDHHDQGHGHGHSGHAHAGGEACDVCGHVHLADPATLAGDFNWKTAASAITAVGLRPCSGAIIVLTFAALNGLVLAGILSVFAMSLGTFVTVSALATLAVTAKNVAMRFAGTGRLSVRLHSLVEVGAALLVALIGGLLFAATFYT